jgi:hypothetical protein
MKLLRVFVSAWNVLMLLREQKPASCNENDGVATVALASDEQTETSCITRPMQQEGCDSP